MLDTIECAVNTVYRTAGGGGGGKAKAKRGRSDWDAGAGAAPAPRAPLRSHAHRCKTRLCRGTAQSKL